MSTNAIIPGYPTTTADGIVLAFSGLSLTLTSFGSYPGEYPRVEPEYQGIEYSHRGAVSRTGTVYRPKVIFTFDASLTLEQQATLQRMEAIHLATPGDWLLHDYTRPWADSGARTRALAPNSTEDTTGGNALYYASFNVEPVQAFRVVERNAREDVVSFQLQETEATTA